MRSKRGSAPQSCATGFVVEELVVPTCCWKSEEQRLLQQHFTRHVLLIKVIQQSHLGALSRRSRDTEYCIILKIQWLHQEKSRMCWCKQIWQLLRRSSTPVQFKKNAIQVYCHKVYCYDAENVWVFDTQVLIE